MAVQFGLTLDPRSLIDTMIEATPKVVQAVQADLPKDFPQRVLEPILDGLIRSAKQLADHERIDLHLILV